MSCGPEQIGPSPRVRGKRLAAALDATAERSIPAGAGKTLRIHQSGCERPVHPRGCGENLIPAIGPCFGCGPSPRVRGKRSGRPESTRRGTVHPRGCGENQVSGQVRMVQAGPSPRVRGKRESRIHLLFARRSIPAGAGKTRRPGSALINGKVHPRGCGENAARVAQTHETLGPSPRVRGKFYPVVVPHSRRRSIPAGAGKTTGWPVLTHSTSVHPRGCGENGLDKGLGEAGRGPSPRVRGKLFQAAAESLSSGSIPAGAGKTSSPVVPGDLLEVHPRGCGENVYVLSVEYDMSGPSPRVRGKRVRATRTRSRHRSIPAGAGKTPPAASADPAPPVHPRGCGENATQAAH